MKKAAFILFVLVFISLSFTSCQKAKEPEGTKEVLAEKKEVKQQRDIEQIPKESRSKEQISTEPQLIWQKDFGTKIHSFKLHKAVGATDFPLMSVETEDSLIIFDKNGKEKTRRPILMLEFKEKEKKVRARGFAIISDNGQYVLEGKGVPEFSYDIKYSTVNGQTLWKKKNFCGEPAVSPNGRVIVLLDTRGWQDKKGNVIFYDSSGNLLKQYPMDLSSIVMPLYALAFSEDGNYFILRLEQWIEDKEGRRAIYPIILFDKKGNLLWKKNIEVTPGKTSFFELLISSHGNRISYSSDKYIYTVNKQGNLLWKKEFHNLGSFSEKEDILLIGKYYIDGASLLIDALSGKGLWFRDRGHPSMSSDGSLLNIIGSIDEPDGKKLTLHIINMADKKENLIFKKKYSHPQKREIQFSLDSKYLYFVEQDTDTKLSVYKISLSAID